MKKKSFAKINLMLDVVERRADGYHELEMITVPVDLFDTIDIKISPTMKMTSNKRYIPNDERNTVIKAIELMRRKYGFKENFTIKLLKNTPTRAGMGGGSSNASLVMRMINELLDLKASEDELMEIAQEVGSDVPFTLYGKPALVRGVGELLEPININMDFFIFIVKPAKGISTPQLFQKLDADNLFHYDVSLVKKALEEGDYDLFIRAIGNSLEPGAIKNVPEIRKAKQDLLNFGFDTAIMSGAGSSVFGITQDVNLVNQAVKRFYRKYDFVKKSRVVKNVVKEESID